MRGSPASARHPDHRDRRDLVRHEGRQVFELAACLGPVDEVRLRDVTEDAVLDVAGHGPPRDDQPVCSRRR